jgi:hypothetical protein
VRLQLFSRIAQGPIEAGHPKERSVIGHGDLHQPSWSIIALSALQA